MSTPSAAAPSAAAPSAAAPSAAAPKKSMAKKLYNTMFGTNEWRAERNRRGKAAAAKVAAQNEGAGTLPQGSFINQAVPISTTGSMRKRSRTTRRRKTRKSRR